MSLNGCSPLARLSNNGGFNTFPIGVLPNPTLACHEIRCKASIRGMVFDCTRFVLLCIRSVLGFVSMTKQPSTLCVMAFHTALDMVRILIWLALWLGLCSVPDPFFLTGHFIRCCDYDPLWWAWLTLPFPRLVGWTLRIKLLLDVFGNITE